MFVIDAGRPAKLYAAAPEQEALELPPRRLPALIARLMDEVPAERLEDALRRAGEDGLVERSLRGVQAEAVECETDSCLDHAESCSVVIRLRR